MTNRSTALYGAPKVGGDILSYCTKCKIELAHVIVSMIDTRPAKVICKTCRGQHNYKRLGVEPTKPRARGTRTTPAARTQIRAAELWEQKVAAKHSDGAVQYSVIQKFAQGDVLKHPKFGVGVVEEVKAGKILVFFQDGEKTLVHAMEKRISDAQP